MTILSFQINQQLFQWAGLLIFIVLTSIFYFPLFFVLLLLLSFLVNRIPRLSTIRAKYKTALKQTAVFSALLSPLMYTASEWVLTYFPDNLSFHPIILCVIFILSPVIIGAFFICGASLFSKGKQIIIFMLVPFFLASIVYSTAFLSGVETKINDDLRLSPPRISEHSGPIYLFGFDAATWDVLYPLQKMGYAPVFSYLIKTGTCATLETLPEGKSLLIWTSVATGKLPAKHGLMDWLKYSMPSLNLTLFQGLPHTGFDRLLKLLCSANLMKQELPDGSDRKAAALWEILDYWGKRSLTVGWWATSPVEELNGVMIANTFFPIIEESIKQKEHDGVNPSCTIYPPSSYSATSTLMKNAYRESEQRFPVVTGINIGTLNKNIPEIPLSTSWFYSQDEAVAQVGHSFLEADTFDVVLLYFRGLDICEHFFWKYFHPEAFSSVDPVHLASYNRVIPRYYQYYDSLLSSYFEKISRDDATILVISDHGMEPEQKPNPYSKSGQHATGPRGIFIMNGRTIPEGISVSDISILDITPSLLHHLKVPLARDFDGSVPEFLHRRENKDTIHDWMYSSYDFLVDSSRFCDTDSGKISADSHIEKSLRQLGYIE